MWSEQTELCPAAEGRVGQSRWGRRGTQQDLLVLISASPTLYQLRASSTAECSSIALPAQLQLHQEHAPSLEKKQALALHLLGCFHRYLSKVKEKVQYNNVSFTLRTTAVAGVGQTTIKRFHFNNHN